MKPLVHPGEVLDKEFLEPLKLTPYRLAKALAVPATRIHEIVKCRRAITADTAIRLAKYFNMSAEFWLGLQMDYDLRTAKAATNLDEVKKCLSKQVSGRGA